ncbi:MAG: LCP family protein [Actinomycetes bacterium]
MSGPKDWPEGWSRGSGRAAAPRDDVERTQVMRVEAPRRGAHPPPPFARPSRGRSTRRWLRRVPLVLLLLVALLLGTFLYFYSRIDKVDAVQDYDGRPEDTSGQNWLIVGSDSREGLSDEEIKTLRLGKVEGRRTDTIILLHKPASGKPTLVSLPRDSYVPIPGQGRNKLNAAYALGGPSLLVRTVEQVSGLRIDHYTEVGFGGFVGMTDAVGGVELCPKRNIRDRKSGLRVQKGCQEMDGPTALAYVRARYFDPKGDLGRVERQQEFLGAVFDRASSPATLLNPFRLVSLGNASTTALTIDDGDGPISLVQFGLTMRAVAGGGGTRTTVPVADPNFSTPAGSAVRWDRDRALELFRSLQAN